MTSRFILRHAADYHHGRIRRAAQHAAMLDALDGTNHRREEGTVLRAGNPEDARLYRRAYDDMLARIHAELRWNGQEETDG